MEQASPMFIAVKLCPHAQLTVISSFPKPLVPDLGLDDLYELYSITQHSMDECPQIMKKLNLKLA